MRTLNVAVVGATGAVGSEIIQLLDRSSWSIGNLHAYSSPRTSGTSIPFRNSSVESQVLSPSNFAGVDVAFLAADTDTSKKLGPKFASSGAVVVDNSSAFRLNPDVPLVIPEVNGHTLGDARLIANPNCCAIILCMAVAPLRAFGRIRRIIVSTYQSASGAGREAMHELEESTRAALNQEPFEAEIFPHPYAFNLFSHNTPISDSGYNGEEEKMILETRRIFGDPELGVNPTCIRVPVLRAHSESVTVEFEHAAPDIDAVRQAIARFPGVKLVDDRENNIFPMPSMATGTNDIYVGRIRPDISNPQAISLFCCGDQILKGAAWNAVQIAELALGIESAE